MNKPLQTNTCDESASRAELINDMEAHRIQLEALLLYMSSQGHSREDIADCIGQNTTKILRDFRNESGAGRFTSTPTPPIPLVRLASKQAPIPLSEEDIIIKPDPKTADYLAKNGDTRTLKLVPPDQMPTPKVPAVMSELARDTEPTQSTIPFVTERTLGEAAILFADRQVSYTLEDDGSVTPIGKLELDFEELNRRIQSGS